MIYILFALVLIVVTFFLSAAYFAKRADIWHARAEALWDVLDSIDTADDIAKDNDKVYRQLVHNQHMKRFNYATSPDGYGLKWKEQ